MPDDLAARLVHDAAEAISDIDGHASSVQPCGDATYPEMAVAAVVAVLEALAAECAGSADWRFVDAAGFRRLAERVKEARNG